MTININLGKNDPFQLITINTIDDLKLKKAGFYFFEPYGEKQIIVFDYGKWDLGVPFPVKSTSDLDLNRQRRYLGYIRSSKTTKNVIFYPLRYHNFGGVRWMTIHSTYSMPIVYDLIVAHHANSKP